MNFPYFRKEEISARFGEGSWQRIIFSEFRSAMESVARPFPCIYGVSGFKADALRFAFLDRFRAEDLDPILRSYLARARNNGRYTSLVIFEAPGEIGQMTEYYARFWKLLDGLVRIDTSPWPKEIPAQMDHPEWEFCFAGEPIFVVCNSPAHVRRQSRRASGMVVTFQPRWVFDGITDTERSAMTAFAAVRKRLAAFDLVESSPALGRYGDPSVREFAQYFLDDTNVVQACPKARLGHDEMEPAERRVRL